MFHGCICKDLRHLQLWCQFQPIKCKKMQTFESYPTTKIYSCGYIQLGRLLSSIALVQMATTTIIVMMIMMMPTTTPLGFNFPNRLKK